MSEAEARLHALLLIELLAVTGEDDEDEAVEDDRAAQPLAAAA